MNTPRAQIQVYKYVFLCTQDFSSKDCNLHIRVEDEVVISKFVQQKEVLSDYCRDRKGHRGQFPGAPIG